MQMLSLAASVMEWEQLRGNELLSGNVTGVEAWFTCEGVDIFIGEEKIVDWFGVGKRRCVWLANRILGEIH